MIKILILIFIWSLALFAQDFTVNENVKKYSLVVPPEDSPFKVWEYPMTSRTVSIADLHGDFDAFYKILIDEKLINESGSWIGKDARLVMLGDLLDRGDQGKLIMKFLMHLEEDAAGKNGSVHVLLGNHELLVMEGYHKYVSDRDAINFFLPSRRLKADEALELYKKFMTSDNEYTRWLRSKKVIIKIGETLYMHGGLEKWAQKVSVENINYTVHSWLNHQHDVGPKPPKKNKWVIEGDGPTWTRKLAHEEYSQKEVEKILDSYSAKRVVLGHTVQDDGVVRSIYKDRVLLSDTGISRVYEGGLSRVVITGKNSEEKIKISQSKRLPKNISPRSKIPFLAPALLKCEAGYLQK